MSPWLSDLYLSSQADARLLSLTRDGHARAFAILTERYRAELLSHARRLSANGNAEDVVQQAFLSAFAALTAGAEVGHPRGWLHAILRHAAIRVRPSGEAPLGEFDACGEPLEVLVERRAHLRSVLTAVDGLPTRQRQALAGSSLQGLSRTELASSLGVSEGAVRQLVHRARLAVRTAITALTPCPLARWLAAAGPNSGTGSELAMTAGAASAGGLVAKVGVFAAAGAIATGVTAIESHPAAHARTHRAHAGPARTAPVVQGTPALAVHAAGATPAAGFRLYVSDRVAGPRSSATAVPHRRTDAAAGHEHGSGTRGPDSSSGSRGESGAPSGDTSGGAGNRSGVATADQTGARVRTPDLPGPRARTAARAQAGTWAQAARAQAARAQAGIQAQERARQRPRAPAATRAPAAATAPAATPARAPAGAQARVRAADLRPVPAREAVRLTRPMVESGAARLQI